MQSGAPVVAAGANGNRLAAISRGERFPAIVHARLAKEQSVVEIQNFNLWYGPKQALHDITFAVPKDKVTALDRSQRLRQIDSACDPSTD